MAATMHGSSGDTTSLNLTGLDALFEPRGVAVFGASSDRSKIGGRPIRFLQESGFAGGIYPINPKYDEVQGLRAYSSLADVDGPVDAAVLALPHHAVEDALLACAEHGVHVVTVFSAGFAELGREGEKQQRRLFEIARERGLRLLGPNCIGSMNRRTGAAVTFAAAVGVSRPELHSGRVAMVSHSGAVAVHCYVAGLERGIDIDPWVSTGNEADIDLADCLAYFALDNEVQVIVAYLEGCSDGPKLREALGLAQQRGKTVVALKVGRSDAGARAVASHTASLVGSDEVFDALFRQYGVCRVHSVEELLDLSYALSLGRAPTGDRVGLLSASGGIGIVMADAAVEAGLQLPELPASVRDELHRIWPPAGTSNPVDTTAQVMNDKALLTGFLDTVVEADEFDTIVIFLTYMGMISPWDEEVVAALRKNRERFPDSNVIVSMLTTPEVRRATEEMGLLVFEDPTVAVRMAARMSRFGAARAMSEPANGARSHARVALPTSLEQFNEVTAKELLRRAGVPVVEDRLVTSAEGAVCAATELGFPVAVKAVSPDLLHKSDVGGVQLGLETAEDVRASYEKILTSVAAQHPALSLDGVLVSPMVEEGVETMLGVVNDPVFGPVVAFGLGGVFVEVLHDVTYRLAPFDESVAIDMIDDIRGSTMLYGARGTEAADVDALAAALSALSHFAADHRDRIESIDVNPFLVRPRGNGAVAVDALIRQREATFSPMEDQRSSSNPSRDEGLT